VIATVAALSEWVAFSQPLEVGVSHSLEQQVVLEREQLAQPSAQMLARAPNCAAATDPACGEAMVVDPLARQPQRACRKFRVCEPYTRSLKGRQEIGYGSE
jgi:hypothetical protein